MTIPETPIHRRELAELGGAEQPHKTSMWQCDLDKVVEELFLRREENLELRKLLWLLHGCGRNSLYGDDGEMQCGHCIIDFKRNSVEQIELRLTNQKEQ